MRAPTATPLTPERTANSDFCVIVLHDDHLTARRGTLVAQAITNEMGLAGGCETALWNVNLLDTHFGHVAAIDASTADIVIVALRGADGFSVDLKTWLGRWLLDKKHSSAALVVVFENHCEPGTRKARAFIERIALSGRQGLLQAARRYMPERV
jgi:hypothetical protein